jgi:hypothetical protein
MLYLPAASGNCELPNAFARAPAVALVLDFKCHPERSEGPQLSTNLQRGPKGLSIRNQKAGL